MYVNALSLWSCTHLVYSYKPCASCLLHLTCYSPQIQQIHSTLCTSIEGLQECFVEFMVYVTSPELECIHVPQPHVHDMYEQADLIAVSNLLVRTQTLITAHL